MNRQENRRFWIRYWCILFGTITGIVLALPWIIGGMVHYLNWVQGIIR